MSARFEFSTNEADHIRNLLREKLTSDRETQKVIRGKLRRLGFYISSFRQGGDGFSEEDFQQLIVEGKITVR